MTPRIDPAELHDWERSYFVPYETRWTGPDDGDMPVEWLPGRIPIPALARIVPERWRQVLLPLNRGRREAAARSHALVMAEKAIATGLWIELPPPPAVPAGGVTVRLGDTPRSEQRRTRQLSIRVSHDEHAEIEASALLVGATPTTLARMLILGGARKIAHDQALQVGG